MSSSVFDGMAAIFRDTFGDAEPFTYTKSGGSSVEITGILEMPALVVNGLAGTDIVTADTELHAAEADLPDGYGEGDDVVARGVTYRTKVPMPDGRGMVRIPLKKVLS
jgi:hypothetical protein